MNKPHRRLLVFILIFALLAVVLLLLFLPPLLDQEPEMTPVVPATPNSFSVLSANVGNMDLTCKKYVYKLCYKDVEERIKSGIQALSPDIIALQEILPPWLCDQAQENRPNRICSNPQEIPQVRRLLGEGYTIACTSSKQYECIAVKTQAGEILGCEPGSLCNTARTGVAIEGCSDGFSVSAVTVRLKDGFQFDVVNAHPQSFNASCRAKMLALIFGDNGGDPVLIQEERVLILGDFNLDPWRDHDESALAWQSYFELGHAGMPFQYHSGIAEKDPPPLSLPFFLARKTIDFAVSNFAEGLLLTLGGSPGTSRLDGGRGMDHRALYGLLTYPADR